MASSFKKQSYALVTGGSSGIGLAFAQQLADKGYNICIVSDEKEKLEALEKEIEIKQKVKCISLFIDLAQDDAAQIVHNFCIEKKLIIEVLINNAGFLIVDEFINVTPKRVNALLKLHTITPTMLCHFMAKDMNDRGKGYILNVSSTSAHMAYPIISLYGPSKSYILNFTKAIRHELYAKNIHVSCIIPGAVDTGLYTLSASKRKLGHKLGIIHNPQFIAKRGLHILFKNKGKSIPGLFNKLSLIFIKLVPDFVVRKLLQSKNRSKPNSNKVANSNKNT